MTTPPFAEITLEDLLPHRNGMLLISEIVEVDSNHARTRSLVQKSWPTANEQGVQSLILVEIAAQTAGVCNGWGRIQSKGMNSNQMGWLVGIKKADFFIDTLPFGALITATAENTYSFESLREVCCELRLNDAVIGQAILQLFQAGEQ
jgi:predicted hotdog family 3-hydroxylacyl-ACP dehydratase